MFKEIAKCVSDIIYNDEDVLLRDITAIVKQRSDHISPIQSEEYTDEGTEDAYATYIAVYQLLLSFELTLDYGGLATQSNLTDLKKDGTEQFEKLLKDIRDKIDYKHM
jgi:hypothetical protein